MHLDRETIVRMGRRAFWSWGGAIGLIGLLISCAARRSVDPASGGGGVVKTIQLSSAAFSANGLIPRKYTCDGQNTSPVLSWDAPPEGTRSLVLIMDDPDAPEQFTHWVLYDLPPELRQLPENVSKKPILNEGGVQGKSDFGKFGYGGPCPPKGNPVETHRYVFRLYALDKLLDLPPGTPKASVLSAIEGHKLAQGELIGRYSR